MSLPVFTAVHVLLSLIGIVAGLVVLVGLLTSNAMQRWTAFFLLTTIITSVTGFFFPVEKLLPSHIVGVISVVLLGVAVVALYGKRLAGSWRPVYVVTALLSLYLNVFVLIVQMFQKIAVLHVLAPTQSETPFIVVQGIALIVFLAVIVVGTRNYKPTAISLA